MIYKTIVVTKGMLKSSNHFNADKLHETAVRSCNNTALVAMRVKYA